MPSRNPAFFTSVDLERKPASEPRQTQAHTLRGALRLGLFFTVIALVAMAPFIGSSASGDKPRRARAPEAAARAEANRRASAIDVGYKSARERQQELTFPVLAAGRLAAFVPFFQAGPETLTLLDGNCLLPKTEFALNEKVCVRVTNAPVGLGDFPARRVNFVARGGAVVQTSDVTAATQTFTFDLPPDETTTFTDQDAAPITVDNRGAWKVTLNTLEDNSVRRTAPFIVRAPTPFVDLTVTQGTSFQGSQVGAGSGGVFEIFVTNNGPDAAQNVVLTNLIPVNTTAGALNEVSGLGFTCNPGAGGALTCTIPTLARGAHARFTFAYEVVTGLPADTEITNVVSISSQTTPMAPLNDVELEPADNTSTATSTVPGTAGAQSCQLNCRENIIATANTSQGGTSGAFVTFSAASITSGSCGAITATPASGSFFPVGSTVVNVTSGTGGGSCSFTITVTDTSAPTITCPIDINVTAAPGDTSKAVTPGTPTTTPANLAVVGERSDSLALNAPYPVGQTLITWTTTDSVGRTATCTQRITVNDANRPQLTMSCPANVTVNAPSGSCQVPISASDLSAPATNPSDSDVEVVGVRSDSRDLSDPFGAGETRITWTATDNISGNVVSCIQSVFVNATDNTPPTVNAPADLTVETSSCSVFIDELGAATAEDDCSASVNITRTGVPSGNVFPVGQTIITYTATDAAGNPATATQVVTVRESAPPTVIAPNDVTLYTGANAASCGATVGNLDTALGTATANDNCAGVVVARTGVPADNVFPVGTTNVTYTATDASGNTATATQTVTVVDNTPPTIAAPADKTVSTDAGSCVATGVDLGTPTADDNCAGVTSANNAPSTFPIGETIVTWTVTDAAGQTATATQKVTVVDNQNPSITAPADKMVNADTNSCGATGVALGTPTTADNCSVASVANDAPSSFPVGVTNVTWTVTDASGNTATATQKVTVLDTQNPTIVAPAAVTLYTGANAASCGVTVGNLDTALGTATAGDNCPGVVVARGGVPSGNIFPVGDTFVTYTATDAHGNHSATVSQKVTVVDNTPPTISCPANITLNLPLNSTATSMVVNYPAPASAADNCGTVNTSYSKPSGSVFPVGTTSVTVTATDAAGNTSSCTFTVTVHYNFTGFFSPVNNLPTLNQVNAGRAIPVKFSLSGNKGLNIFAPNSPSSGVIACNAGDVPVDVTETVTAGGSSLSYGSGDQYHYVWKTDSSWAGTCRQLVMTLNDGSVHRANFKFK